MFSSINGRLGRFVVTASASFRGRVTHQPGRVAGTLVIGCAALVSMFATGSASAASTPYHADAPYGAYCYTGQYTGATIDAYVPADMRSVSGLQEAVYWRADLYRYGSTGWYLYDSSRPWLQAQATGNGLIMQMRMGFQGVWSEYPNGRFGIRYEEFPSLPKGQYAVVETYYWSNGLKSVQSELINASSPICTIS